MNIIMVVVATVTTASLTVILPMMMTIMIVVTAHKAIIDRLATRLIERANECQRMFDRT
jgi:hypothetical protein